MAVGSEYPPLVLPGSSNLLIKVFFGFLTI
ncbi:hypothetical protein NC651_013532 [Populus alba x Populus x berolinensis]|nr:hypothetical protein NC651_013532 [Populus alba x Populus x berolinensis]